MFLFSEFSMTLMPVHDGENARICEQFLLTSHNGQVISIEISNAA